MTKLPKPPSHFRKKIAVWWKIKRRVLLALFFFLLSFTLVSAAQAPVLRRAIKAITTPKPKVITQSAQLLPQDVQTAIVNLAQQQIQQTQAEQTLAVSAAAIISEDTPELSVLERAGEELQLLIANPVDKATIRLKQIDRQIRQLVLLARQDRSDRTVNEIIGLIEEIGRETDSIVTDPAAQADRAVLGQVIRQYNRLQLVIQQIEDTLPLAEMLTVEDARVKYLVVAAQASINAAPSLEVVQSLGLAEVTKLVGADFAQLKAMEILSDLESGLTPETKVKLAAQQRELAAQFEQNMLKLPPAVRLRKLQDYIQFSHGNPIRQVQAIEHMEEFLTDRELILGMASLKELALERLADRVFETATPEVQDQFLDRVLQNPEDIKTLAQMQLYVQAGGNPVRQQQLAERVANAQGKIVALFGQDPAALDRLAGHDVIDVSILLQIERTLASTPSVGAEVKVKATTIRDQTIQAFLADVASSQFISQPNLAYNPVAAATDVRLLPPNPAVTALLQSLTAVVAPADQPLIAKALRAQAALLNEHLLLQVTDPATFANYRQFIANNPTVRQALQQSLGQTFFTNLATKGIVIATIGKAEEQQLYEVVQQITQEIFLTDQATQLEQQLPEEIQTAIQDLKAELPTREIPQLTLPEGVTLSETAQLPDDVAQAIIAAAQHQIAANQQSEEAQLDLTVEAGDLGLAKPIILPDSLFYPVKDLVRDASLLLAFDSLSRAAGFVQNANEKTLEAAVLLEKDQSRETISRVLELLADVRNDFTTLREKASNLEILRIEEPAKVDALVNTIIANGVARQTIFSAIEARVYGADFVAVEKLRHEVLQEGVSTLLILTGGDVQLLVDKVVASLENQTSGQFKEIKAIELITEIKRDQPAEVDVILEAAEVQLARQLEAKLLTLPPEEWQQALLDYADAAPGNPVRQFETYEQLKDSFEDPQTILITEALKDKAVENLRDLVAQITDGTTLADFVDQVVGDRPEDLKIMVEIQLRIAPSIDSTVLEPLPIVEKVEEIVAQVQENIIDTFGDDPAGLADTDFYSDPSHEGETSVVDVVVAQQLEAVLATTPEVAPAVVAMAQDLEQAIIDQFIEAVSEVDVTDLAATEHILEPVPLIIETLVELKADQPPAVDSAIDVAIEVQVDLLEEHLTTQVDDPVTFETYVNQIESNPVVAAVVEQVGGTEFAQAIEEQTEVINETAATEQTLLEETVAAVQEEIFAAPIINPSPIEETLPETIQAEIEEIKTEVLADQIPTVIVETTVTVEPTVEPAPTEVPATTEPITAPVEQIAPPPAQPTVAEPAPAVPGL